MSCVVGLGDDAMIMALNERRFGADRETFVEPEWNILAVGQAMGQEGVRYFVRDDCGDESRLSLKRLDAMIQKDASSADYRMGPAGPFVLTGDFGELFLVGIEVDLALLVPV